MNQFTVQEFDQMTQEIYTTHDSNRRNALLSILPQELANEQQSFFFLRILEQTTNEFALQYLVSLFTSSVKKHPHFFKPLSNQIQVVLLEVVNSKTVPNHIYRSIFSLFALLVVSTWDNVQSQTDFVQTIKQLIQQQQIRSKLIASYLMFYVMDDSRSKNEEIIRRVLSAINSGIFLCHSWHYEEDDPSWIHLPKNIYLLLEDIEFYQQLFADYLTFQNTPTSSTILELLFVTSSFKRIHTHSNFQKSEVVKAVSTFIGGVVDSRAGLNTNDNLVLMCRLLLKFRSNQLTTQSSDMEWISSIENFTEFIFSGTNNVCINNMLNKQSQLLSFFIPLVQVFMRSTLDNVITYFKNDPAEDPYLIPDQLTIIYDGFGPIARCVSDAFMREVNTYMSQLIQRFDSIGQLSKPEREIVTAQLAWVLEMIISVLQARMNTSADPQTSRNDFNLSNIGFNFVMHFNNYVKTNPNIGYITDYIQSGDFRLQTACIHFMNIFRRMVVSESTYTYNQQMTVENKQTTTVEFLHFFIDLIGTVLSSWRNCTPIITSCLELFETLSTLSYFSNHLFRFDIVKKMVTEDHTALLSHINAPIKDLKKLHHQLYKTLGALMFNCRMPVKVKTFLDLFIPIIQQISTLNETGRLTENPLIVCLLFTDLSAIIKSTETTHVVHLCLYDFLIVHILPLTIPLIHIFHQNIDVSTSILKFFVNITSSKNFKDDFPIESPSCMTLFKSISLAISVFCQLFVSTKTNDNQNIYSDYYKPLCLCLKAMSYSFQSKTVCFSVFEIYNDTVLTDVFTRTLEIALQIPFHALEEYPKIVTCVYSYIESLSYVCKSSLNVFKNENIQMILQLIQKGMSHKSPVVIIHCCKFIEALLSVYYKATLNLEKLAAKQVNETLRTYNEGFNNILWICFDNLLNDFDVWALASPILLIFKLFPNSFDTVMSNLTHHIKNSNDQTKFITETSMLKNLIPETYDEEVVQDFEILLQKFISDTKLLFR
ncbi:Ran binding protein [Entamoeba marina]